MIATPVEMCRPSLVVCAGVAAALVSGLPAGCRVEPEGTAVAVVVAAPAGAVVVEAAAGALAPPAVAPVPLAAAAGAPVAAAAGAVEVVERFDEPAAGAVEF